MFVDHCDVFYVAGVLATFYVFVKITVFVFVNFRAFVLARFLPIGVDFKGLGAWAVVTGATDGIGKQYARQLAQKGLNIVLISRSTDKLNRVAAEIERESQVKTKCVTADFMSDVEIYHHIATELEGLDVGVLVNNVSTSAPHPEYFKQVNDMKALRDIVLINCVSVILMTHIVLPRMIKAKKGAIVNVSSLASVTVSPMCSTYAATKAFTAMFSQSLEVECRHTGVIIQTLRPYFVSTNMAPLPLSFSVPDAETFVKSAIATIGIQSDTYGYFPHTFVSLQVALSPSRVLVEEKARALYMMLKHYEDMKKNNNKSD